MTETREKDTHSLRNVPLGCDVTIRRLHFAGRDVSTRMREMGIRENATIRLLLRGNGNMICLVNNMRIGIDEKLADAILVEYDGQCHAL
jgi:Fe2+ transport system protein FeoA